MTTFNFTVSPDFEPDRIASWFIFSTWLQKHVGISLHLELHNSFEEQHSALDQHRVDLIYANPYDAALLVREHGFRPVTRPHACQDEALIVVHERDGAPQQVEDLQPGLRVATTNDPDVNMIGMIMIEPAELNAGNIEIIQRPNHLLVAKAVLHDEADIGFVLEKAYQGFSALLQQQLRPLVASAIRDISHLMLASPRMQMQFAPMQDALLTMHEHDKGRGVLRDLGFDRWEAMSPEDVELMIDLMETLAPD